MSIATSLFRPSRADTTHARKTVPPTTDIHVIAHVAIDTPEWSVLFDDGHRFGPLRESTARAVADRATHNGRKVEVQHRWATGWLAD